MDRTELTAAAVTETERLLRRGIDQATIAARLGLSEYVVGVIANDPDRPKKKPRPSKSVHHRVRNVQRDIDATTIRMVQRMLEVGILDYAGIAHEAGVSINTVGDVARGERPAVTLVRPVLDKGERFLARPIRCRVCRASISVAPCRACRARRAAILSHQPA